ncbi:hypothetical protein PR003_g13360 [Phytophthora rubi]|uniref:Secreted protein n=1 Tax=Phytophthora rubi TaxID=129364 RepID=A0A6A4F2F7_9STRA|nr:hypothetical protein PR001_g13210 [Phytophthora rubi]KAE9022684.1 hypothetical protein PR002_g11910 [Phytophthora rubi]KAE9334783.1 hypothetical protein PR003_g13360 [Phytophthora rubi]
MLFHWNILVLLYSTGTGFWNINMRFCSTYELITTLLFKGGGLFQKLKFYSTLCCAQYPPFLEPTTSCCRSIDLGRSRRCPGRYDGVTGVTRTIA